MTKEQFYGWSNPDAAPLNEPATPRPETWLTKRMKEKADNERSESDGTT